MPVIPESTYQPSFLFRFRHINTIYPAFLRSFPGFSYKRERIFTPDGDFLDLDWSGNESDRLIIVLHGLEGSAQRPYVKGIIKHFNLQGWDGVGLNQRSCSGALNVTLRSYHMGVSDDLELVVNYILEKYKYKTIVLAGFSMGGNILLKYLGEQKNQIPKTIKACLAFSVPCEIESANEQIGKWYNRHYVWRFMGTLNKKMLQKARKFPGLLNVDKPLPRNFTAFDDRFTSKLHGFKDAVDYWRKCSSLPLLEDIRVPVLLVNAKDDSFLSEKCFPYEIAKKNPYFYLETPDYGGHVGFAGHHHVKGAYWSEIRAFEFVSLIISESLINS